MARFSLTLIEALLFERVHLTGGAALLIRWGDRNEFAVTLGGFHPSFRPFIPEGLREPPRLGAYWKPHPLVELSIKAYFALTSTSLQFGFAAHVEAGASWGGFRADTEFNFLVMTEPDIRFELDLSFRVTVFLFGCDLISASLSGAISGPGPWTMEGSVYWEVCGVDISKDFGPYEWGDSPPQLGTQQQEARQVLGDALAAGENWTVRRNPRLAVRLRPENPDALDPRDQIDIRQTRLPLGVALEVHDANRLSDPGAWTLQPATGGLRKVSDITDVFPTRRYLQRPPKETPFRGGLVAGARVGGHGWSVRADLAVESDESITEDLVLDSLPVRPKRLPLNVFVPIVDAVLVAAPTRSIERKWTRHTLSAGGRAMKLVFLPHVREGIVPTSSAGARCTGVGRRAPRVAWAASARRQSRDDAPRTGRRRGHRAASGAARNAGIGHARRRARVLSVDRVRRPRSAVDLQPDRSVRHARPAVDGRSSSSRQRPTSVSSPGQQGQSPLILRLPPAVASRELPDLADSLGVGTCAGGVCRAGRRSRRRWPIIPIARCRASCRRGGCCPSVPTSPAWSRRFSSGRIAGLGRDPASEPTLVTGHEPAWSASDMPSELPVYYSWSFRTGEAGDFESLAQRLHAAPLDASIPTTPLHLSLPSGDGTLAVDWEPPLRVRGQTASKPRRPAAAVSQIKSVLAASSPTRRVLGPGLFRRAVDRRPSADTAHAVGPELNLTPMFRAAASLGAEAVRGEQDALVAAASDQLDAFRARQREGRRRQLAATFENRVKLRWRMRPRQNRHACSAPLAVSHTTVRGQRRLCSPPLGANVLRKAVIRSSGILESDVRGTTASIDGAAPTLTRTTSSSPMLTRTSVPANAQDRGRARGQCSSMPLIFRPVIVRRTGARTPAAGGAGRCDHDSDGRVRAAILAADERAARRAVSGADAAWRRSDHAGWCPAGRKRSRVRRGLPRRRQPGAELRVAVAAPARGHARNRVPPVLGIRRWLRRYRCASPRGTPTPLSALM